MNGKELIAEERKRQIQIGHDATHDDAHVNGEIYRAAECYLANAADKLGELKIENFYFFKDVWPWGYLEWRPSTIERDLVKAGALFTAEADRLRRRISKTTDQFEIHRIKLSILKPEGNAICCAQKLDSLRMTRWQRFKRNFLGGWEYGHVFGKSDTIHRRNIRTGAVYFIKPRGWIIIHSDHWHKFWVADVGIKESICPICKGHQQAMSLHCRTCDGTGKIIEWGKTAGGLV